ncbi:hypothetical protein K457DRAFT_886174 [Linnemannia elongata AG-77]|uniref:Ricin B lectin domain-containing protein n=1 Tax=Linnemannia elongata AG-77 TaxID=1314771 RepID=A0A197KGV6_9FUNG|nr:hypothetical protein K457DRAFT_886174 [Linnemannia elongata AG-77]
MLRSAASLIVLSLVAIQTVVASTIRPGTYLIQDSRSQLFLGIGPVPPVYPPLDAPVSLVPQDSPFNQRWIVKEGDDGGIIITTGRDGPYDYKIVRNDNDVIVSARKAPETWEASQVGDGSLIVQIKLPYEDRVFTANQDDFPQVTLQRSIGEDNQIFRFIPILRDLYHPNRFTVQDTC